MLAEPALPTEAKRPVDGIRIAWDYSTRQRLSPEESRYAGYARMIALADNSLFCVYESEGSTYAIKSSGTGNTWSAPIMVAARENEVSRVVPEVLQLQDNSLLVSYNLRPHARNTDTTKRFGIEVKRSTDGGTTWSVPVEVYKAGHEFTNGCWEPAQIQLPSGEVQLYIANEGPYTQSNEQEITMFRSEDQGMTWTKGETVSFRKGYRDGMPVPLILKNGKEIVFVIEDNGIEGPAFKPVIIRTPLDDNWNNKPVSAESKDRHHAMDVNNRIPGPKYAGAPYIRQLASGETILSYQGNEWRKGNKWDVSDMIVAIGSEDARDFNRKSRPFFFDDTTKTCLWNSLTVVNDTTVIALASTNAYSDHTGVWMIRGRVLREPSAKRGSVNVDGLSKESVWRRRHDLFLGGYGPSKVHINLAWDDKSFYVLADVIDNDVTPEDAVIFYFDPKRQSGEFIDENVFSLEVSSQGKVVARRGGSRSWKDWKSGKVSSAVKRTERGYRWEIGIPWTEFGVRAAINNTFGFQVLLHERTASGAGYEESLSGNQNDAPFTWSPVNLID